jgi:hypothetical protein
MHVLKKLNGAEMLINTKTMQTWIPSIKGQRK